MARTSSTLAALALVLGLAAGSASAAEQKLIIRGAADGAADPRLAATAPAPLYPYPYNPSDLYAPSAYILVPGNAIPNAGAGAPLPAADVSTVGAPSPAGPPVDADAPAGPAGAGGARRRLMSEAAANAAAGANAAAATNAATAEASAATAGFINPIYIRRGAWMPNPFARPYPYPPYNPYNPYPDNPYIGSSAGAAKLGRKMLGF